MQEQCDECAGREYTIGDAVAPIAQGRWHVTSVMAGHSRSEPPFSYSAGLTSLGHPELIVVGLSQWVGASLVNMVGDRLIAGESIAHGARLQRTDSDFDLVTIDAHDTSEMYETISLYREFTALQIVFPDEKHLFPWQRGYGLAPWVQPLKGSPPS